MHVREHRAASCRVSCRGAGRRTVATAIVLTATLGIAAVGLRTAEAAPPRRVGVVKLAGPGEKAIRAWVMRAAKTNRYQVVGGEQIEKVARKQRVGLDSDASFEVIARALGITAFVTGQVSRQRATLTVRDGSGGAIVDTATWAAPDPWRLAISVGRTFWKRLGPAITRSKAPSGAKLDVAPENETLAVEGEEGAPGGEAAPEEESAPPPRVAAAPPAPRTGSRRQPPPEKSEDGEAGRERQDGADRAGDEDDGEGPGTESTRTRRPAGKRSDAPAATAGVEQLDEALSVAIGPRYGLRSLSYVDDRYDMNSSYSLPRAPIVGVDADFFPAALSGRGVLASVGVTGSFEYLLPFVESRPFGGGPESTTRGLAGSVGLKVRLPAGFYVTGAVGDRFYELVDKPNVDPTDVPTANYQFIRGGAGVRRRLSSNVMLMAHGAYLHCLKLGQIAGASYYPHAKGAGFEAGLAFGFLISSRFEVRGGVDVQRFGLAFNVRHDDFLNGARTAGGAVDLYSEAWVALAFLIAPDARVP